MPLPPPPRAATPPPPPRRRSPIATILIVCGVAFLLFITAVIAFIRFERSHSFAAYAMNPIHLDATLEAPLAGSVVNYRLKIKPQPGTRQDFVAAFATARDMPFHFVLHLLDDQGHVLCSATPHLTVWNGFNEDRKGLEAQGTFLDGCGVSQFRRGTRFSLDSNVPRGEFLYGQPAPHTTAGAQPLPYPQGTVLYASMIGTDYLSGQLFLEQPSRTYTVPNNADLLALREAMANNYKQPVIINCQLTTCILLDNATGARFPVVEVPNQPPTTSGDLHIGS